VSLNKCRQTWRSLKWVGTKYGKNNKYKTLGLIIRISIFRHSSSEIISYQKFFACTINRCLYTIIWFVFRYNILIFEVYALFIVFSVSCYGNFAQKVSDEQAKIHVSNIIITAVQLLVIKHHIPLRRVCRAFATFLCTVMDNV